MAPFAEDYAARRDDLDRAAGPRVRRAAVQTGLRISALSGLTVADVSLGTGAHVHTVGKGRKERRTPLVPLTVAVMRAWLAERGGSPSGSLFPTSTGRPLSRDAIERRVALYVSRAVDACPSLCSKHVTARTLRHTAAMRLLLSPVDVIVIALWLGHEQLSTTSCYLHAEMAQKERVIARGCVCRGTNLGQCLGVPPTGRSMQVDEVWFLTVADDASIGCGVLRIRGHVSCS